MASTRNNASMSSSEKKRIRDRRAQHNMRQKKEKLIKSLEEKVMFCEQNHPRESIGPLMETIESLRRENERLRDHIKILREDPNAVMDVSQCSTSTAPAESVQLPEDQDNLAKELPADEWSSSEDYGASLELIQTGGENKSRLLGDVLNDLTNSFFAADSPFPSASPISDNALHFPTISLFNPSQTIPFSAPTWCLVPMDCYDDNAFLLPGHCPWLSYPELIADCSPLPSPLDLLHGTKRNFLADQINQRMRLRRVRDPECLGFGFLCYLFSKWRASPNPTTFARLPPFMHPIVAQFQRGHPNALDFPVWPQLRMNLIKKWHLYDYFELVGYLACCARVRWPFGEPILERDANDNLQIRQKFLNTVTQESGWGLTSEFIDKYPELLEGMDVEAVRFRVDLP
ncbi:hypothetical protein P170DRAFT_7779 [Aspergillus steynii IBT 23096]|uniref:BZIP transcription factor n=1 Tax=Aspergillus steynii IBT 23096 TaxID=1392250 RepID=A0A2I2GMF2_9EURO|nr:uncharacterized protein P170DRAFT_7779 [Aspergillus steynii IBT 23096]PLB54062.1 hypothetical protein P170DRAFT_7779 [Aspergillus steynii IBT 23096]